MHVELQLHRALVEKKWDKKAGQGLIVTNKVKTVGKVALLRKDDRSQVRKMQPRHSWQLAEELFDSSSKVVSNAAAGDSLQIVSHFPGYPSFPGGLGGSNSDWVFETRDLVAFIFFCELDHIPEQLRSLFGMDCAGLNLGAAGENDE